MRIIITRPEEDTATTIAALEEVGHEGISAPLITIEAQFDTEIPPREWQGVLVSSANGVRALVERSEAVGLAHVPLLAVGEASASAANKAGFRDVKSANGGLPELVALAQKHFSPAAGPLLYLSGTVISGDLKSELEGYGFQVHRAEIYTAKAAEKLPSEALEALKLESVDGVGLFSRRSAKIWAELASSTGLDGVASKLVHICLSPAVANEIESNSPADGIPKMLIAGSPDLKGFLKALQNVH
ncbi:MAG: uroporphyrinogen-III synthase [Hyphomicrobiales bacterium]